MRTLLYSIFLLLIFSFSLSAQQTGNIDEEKLDNYIKTAIKDWEIPGLAIAVVHKGEVIFEKGYGLRNVETGEPVTTNTLFAIASNTKSFTAAALSVLVDRGVLDWDEPVRTYLPWFKLYDPYVTENITVRDLLCHRAGFETFSGDLLWYGSSYTSREVVERARFLKPKYPFRTTYGYSNVMFITAGEIIPAVTDTSWQDFVSHHLLKPLKMDDSNTSITAFKEDGDIAHPYHTEPGKDPILLPYINWDNMAPAGAINSSVSDMSHWLLMQLNNGIYEDKRLLTEEQIEIVRTPHTIQPVSAGARRFWSGKHFEAYALGWNTFDYRGMQIIEHGGGADGMISITCIVPEAELGFVVLTNSINYLPSALMYYILDMYAGAEPKDWSSTYLNFYMRRYVEEKQRMEKAEADRNKNSKPSLPLEAYTGTYGGDLYGDAEISLENGKLVMDFLPSPLFVGDLSHWQYNSFKIVLRDRPNLPPGTVNFIIEPDGTVSELRVDIPNPDFDFTELEFLRRK